VCSKLKKDVLKTRLSTGDYVRKTRCPRWREASDSRKLWNSNPAKKEGILSLWGDYSGNTKSESIQNRARDRSVRRSLEKKKDYESEGRKKGSSVSARRCILGTTLKLWG